MTDFDIPCFRARRRRLVEAAAGQNAAWVIPTAPLRQRTRTTHYPYRPDADFLYLTGFDEPGAVLVVVEREGRPHSVLFLRDRDPAREVWDGRRLGLQRAPRALGVEQAFAIGELAERLPGLLADAGAVNFPLGRYAEHDGWWRELEGRCGPPLADPAPTLNALRVIKGAEELALMRRAAAATAAGFAAAWGEVRPGAYEYQIEAALEAGFRRVGARGPAYNSIVAAGEHATCLHHDRNDGVLGAGTLLLVDAGAEWDGYACDVSRTVPVSGRFTPLQREAYGWVLAAQQAAIAELRVGRMLDGFHERAVEVLVEGLMALGVLAGDPREAIATEAYKPYFMHRTGHFLGLEVHDPGEQQLDGVWQPLEPGMVLTVEPGLYFPRDDKRVPAGLRGTGIRIEDDVLVRAEGPEVLTAAIPKDIEALEGLLAGQPALRP